MHKTGPASSLDSLPEEDRFRADALELFLSGAVSAERASRLCGFAQAAGASGVQDLARARQGKNTARNLLRRTLRQNVWPPPYECQVRGLNQRTGKEESYSLAVMLPHEVLHAIMRANSAENIRKEQAKIPSLQEQLQAEDEDVLLVALWLDGVPFNSDRSQTLQCLTLSVPGLSDQADFRFPVTGFPKHFQMPACTWDDLMTITAWSLQCLYTGHEAAPRRRRVQAARHLENSKSSPPSRLPRALRRSPRRLGGLQRSLATARLVRPWSDLLVL